MITVDLTPLEALLIARLLLVIPDESELVGLAEGIAEKISLGMDALETVGP
jgi:hypothetical protein